MPRNSRNLPAGSVVHVVNRGNDKRDLFQRPQEFEEFLQLVLWAKAICPVRIVAYCIMSNHWHFSFWVEIEWDVSCFLHRLTMTHARRWRRTTQTLGQGQVYQGRFKARPIFTERHYFNVLRYIEQNPVRANLVQRCQDWQWSSLAERLGNGRGILDPDPVGVPMGWLEIVEAPLPQNDAQEIRSSLRRY
jgi:putative transposase